MRWIWWLKLLSNHNKMWVCILPLFGVCEHCSGRWGAGVAKHRLRWGPQPRWKKQCRLGLKLGFPNSWASRSCWELWGVWMEGSCWWQAGAGEAGTQLNSEHHEAFSGRLRQQLTLYPFSQLMSILYSVLISNICPHPSPHMWLIPLLFPCLSFSSSYMLLPCPYSLCRQF